MKGEGAQENRPRKGKHNRGQHPFDQVDLARVEFHRHGLALIPQPADKGPGLAVMVENPEMSQASRFCSCPTFRSRTCQHVLKLSTIWKSLESGNGVTSLWEAFKKSIWHRLAKILAEGSPCSRDSVHIVFSTIAAAVSEENQTKTSANARIVKVIGSRGEDLLHYLSQGLDMVRFLDRCGSAPHGLPSHRCAALKSLALLTLAHNERLMMERGFETRGQAFEKSFWHRLAYHAFRELGLEGYSLRPEVEEGTGSFTIICRGMEKKPCFRLFIPRNKVRAVLDGLRPYLPNQHDLEIHPLPLKSIFKVSMDTEMDLELRPMIQLIQEDGEAHFLEREDLERFRYGDLIYIKELGIIAEMEKPGPLQRRFTSPRKMVLKKSQVPSFLQEFGNEILGDSHLVEGGIESIKVFSEWDRLEISPETMNRDWCRLSVKYGFGKSNVSLQEILRTRKSGERYLGTEEGWVDCESSTLDGLEWFSYSGFEDMEGDALRLSRLDLLRLKAITPGPVHIKGNERRRRLLETILAFKPLKPLPLPKGMVTPLRPYQQEGLYWLGFLYENGLGGLLCDEMGLGKTHEAMAFVLCLLEQKRTTGPFLVVSPTTVLSHWEKKLSQHAPGSSPRSTTADRGTSAGHWKRPKSSLPHTVCFAGISRS